MSTGRRPRLVPIAAALVLAALTRSACSAEAIPELLQQTYWGESSEALLRQFGSTAIRLPRALDFGDSYTDLVLNGETVGGVPVVVFFQMDKRTHSLKRIQLERPRHGVNPPAFRAITAALRSAYGNPDQICVVPVHPATGYQDAAQEIWLRGEDAITAILRDTTLEAFEGCIFGITSGPCGLTGQLLVRLSPADGIAEPDPCGLALRYSHPIPSPSSNR
jgi:hypothetical protein